jgi:hypothetical protein
MDHLFISCVGSFRCFYPGDGWNGGIVAIRIANDLNDISCAGYVIEESDVNGDITGFAVKPDGSAGYAVIMEESTATKLICFDPSTKSVKSTLKTNDGTNGSLSEIALHSSGKLFICDRNILEPGVRVFDTVDNDRPLNGNKPVYVGLPPDDILFVE